MDKKRYYMVRTAKNSFQYAKKGVAAIGWSEIPFSEFAGRTESLKEAVEQRYYSETDTAGANRIKGIRLHEVMKLMGIREGDIILTPCPKGFYIGTALGQFVYDPNEKENDLANWLKVSYKLDKEGLPLFFPRKGNHLGIVQKLGVRGFTILEYKDADTIAEIDKLLNSEDEVTAISRFYKIEQEAQERLIKELENKIGNYGKLFMQGKGVGLEELICELFELDGFSTTKLSKQIGKEQADADILAEKPSDLSDAFCQRLYIQVKHHYGETGTWGLEQLIQFREQIGETGMNAYVLVTSGDVKQEVKDRALLEEIHLIDRTELAQMIVNKLGQLSRKSRYALGLVMKYEEM